MKLIEYNWEDIELIMLFDRELEKAIFFEECLRYSRFLEQKPFNLLESFEKYKEGMNETN